MSYPLVCSECRERVFDDTDNLASQAHCFDEDSGEPVGQFDWDFSYDWRDEDPRIP